MNQANLLVLIGAAHVAVAQEADLNPGQPVIHGRNEAEHVRLIFQGRRVDEVEVELRQEFAIRARKLHRAIPVDYAQAAGV